MTTRSPDPTLRTGLASVAGAQALVGVFVLFAMMCAAGTIADHISAAWRTLGF